VAKYGSFDYSEEKYGTGDAVEYLTWYFGVYWNASFVDESSRMTDLQVTRGRDHLLSTNGGWERFKAGEASAVFDNDNGRYSAFNASGPLYGFLLPGRVVRITVAVKPPYSDTTTTYPILRGIIDDIQDLGEGQNGRRQARIVVKDGLEWLARRSIALALAQDDEALVTAAAIADQVGFDDVDDWSIEQLGPDSVVVPFAFGNDASALALINELVDAEAGQVFHAADGALVFVTNDYEETDETDVDQEEILKDFELRQPWEVVRTRAVVVANPMVAGASAVLWSYGNEGVVATWTAQPGYEHPTSPYLSRDVSDESPDYTLTVDAIFSTGGPSTSPTVDYDFLITQWPFAFPANWVDAVTDFPASIDETNFVDIGNGLRLNFVWDGTGGWGEIVIPWVEITATPIEVVDPVTATASDSGAITTYGEKTFSLDNTFVQAQGRAQAYADYVVNQLKAAKLFPTIQIEARGALQYAPELYVSKINLTIAALGIDDTFRVGKIEHRWLNENGLATVTKFKLEPVLGVL
jgi:hypothetical protein